MVAMTIRNVPDDVRDELAARAARSGRSLQEYLLAELTAIASRPDAAVTLAKVRERVRLTGATLTTDDILEARDAGRR